jgi:hypothetical protein
MRQVRPALIMAHHLSKAFSQLMAESSGEAQSVHVCFISLIPIVLAVHGMEVYILFQGSRSYALFSRYGDSLLQCMHG